MFFVIETRDNKGCNKWEMRAKIMSLFLIFFSSRTERKHMKEMITTLEWEIITIC